MDYMDCLRGLDGLPSWTGCIAWMDGLDIAWMDCLDAVPGCIAWMDWMDCLEGVDGLPG